ncbi:MAG: hypothetical protein PHE84_06590 [bacterium]|nr:hypothetical protein [bacterium]
MENLNKLIAGCLIAGSSLLFYSCPGGKSYHPGRDWLNGMNFFIYGRPPLEYIEAVGGTGLAWSVYHGGFNAEEHQYVRELHRKGIIVASNFATMQGSPGVIDDPELLSETACETFAGSKAYALWIFPDSPYLPCNNNSKWNDFLNARVEEHLHGEADAIDIDEVEGIAGHLYLAGFCPSCMDGFRQYLKDNFSPPEINFRLGIGQLDEFNYKSYLQDKGASKLEDDPNPDLRREFVRFQLKARQKQLKGLVGHANNYAGRQVPFTANTVLLSAHRQVFIPDLDFLVYEYPLELNPLGKHLGVHLLARAMDPKKPAFIFPDIRVLLDFQENSMDWNIFTHWMAEAASAGEGMLIPYQAYVFGGGQETVSGGLTAPPEIIRPYTKFFQENQDLVLGTELLAEVGLVYHQRTVLNEFFDYGYATPWSIAEASHLAFLSAAEILEEEHIPFEVVYVGDEDFVPGRGLSLLGLEKFKTVILPSPLSFSEAETGVINDYRSQGGKVVEMKDLSLRDRKDSKFPDARAEFVNQVTAAVSDPLIVTDAPREIGIVAGWSSDRIFLHLINYNYSQGSGFVPQEGINISLRLPPSGSYGLEWMEPGGAGGVLNYSEEGERIKFVLPVLHEYCLVVFSLGFPVW